ncbi:class I SAM-dependent methyltransferase [Aeromicrobium choanae]|uniref:2-polyprenyl-3-methyl-5-hydroxy-6-metoxy-1,4-benzoquinol methylase n=1 Tax=Aeromicrobium choanae TaxID=1736691 RepID=A0A1T4Z882_9ACTN|nr:class I SAM-dependent methyltransferase [Aeromicrobium choanae]SKB10088.1 2-polyprenyl-3-methyl-5-hydroxy-6-metoxy-1,4-benzoquinol methylase [Aeromicrobium choanae]
MESRSADTTVHETNLTQAESWDGAGGEYWAAHADRFDRAVADYQERFESDVAVRRGERVLDVGCGGGLTTRRAARASVDGEVLGVDLSSQLLDVARSRAEAEGLGTVRFVRADAQVHAFEPGHYDVVLSRTGAMFFGDPVAAFANLRDATRPGGRMVLMTWQPPDRNDWIRVTLGVLGGAPGPTADLDAPGMFSLSRPERIRAVLEAAGWTHVEVDGVEGREWFGADVDDALGFLRGLFAWLLDELSQDERDAAIERLRESLAAHVGPGGVEFGSAVWLVTARKEATDEQ